MQCAASAACINFACAFWAHLVNTSAANRVSNLGQPRLTMPLMAIIHHVWSYNVAAASFTRKEYEIGADNKHARRSVSARTCVSAQLRGVRSLCVRRCHWSHFASGRSQLLRERVCLRVISIDTRGCCCCGGVVTPRRTTSLDTGASSRHVSRRTTSSK